MTDTINIPRAEIQAVLDAIHDARDYLDIINTQAAESKSRRLTKLFEVLRTRLAQQEEKPTPWTTDSAGRITQTPKQEEKPEPVAWMCLDDPERETAFTWKNGHCKNCGKNRIPLYTAPPKREWQGLTDDEIRRLYRESRQPGGAVVRTSEQIFQTTCRTIEAKLKEKNNG